MKKDKRTKKKNSFKYVFILPALIFSIFVYGCPSNNVKSNNFYLSGTISVSSPSTVSVYIAFYSKDCKITFDQQGTITSLENFTIIGQPIEYDVFGTYNFLVVLPEPYDSIGGVIAWIDSDNDGYPDTFDENVIFLKHFIDGYNSIITGINYDETQDNFLLDYQNEKVSGQNYLTVIGNTDYMVNF